jgi:hypothetical protein
MRISVNYGWKTFGNGTTPKNYRVTVDSSEYGLSVRINFDRSVKGQGGFTENNSRVSSASLYMPREHAQAIGEAILKALASEDDESVTLQFGTVEESDEG